MVLMTTGILWLLPKAHALIAGPEVFEAQQYDGSAYTLDLADGRLALVNANLPLTAEPTPELAVADDATGQQLLYFILAALQTGWYHGSITAFVPVLGRGL